MSLSFFLQKMKIVQLNEGLSENPLKVFKVMFNPANYTEKYGLDYSVDKGINGRDNFSYSVASNETMAFDLMLDGSNTNMYLPEALLRSTSVEEKIDELFDISGFGSREIPLKEIKPERLRISYGRLRYDCILTDMEIEYLLFDRDGTPLRARLKTTFRQLPDSLKPMNRQATVSPSSDKDAIALTLSVS